MFRASAVTGTKYLRKLMPLLERLHCDGCARDKAGNRRLHFDHSCTLILLYLFNPVVVSLRGLQQASELQKVQKLLGCKRASLGSLSEAVTVFDPDRLKEIIAELGEESERRGEEMVPLGRDPGSDRVDRKISQGRESSKPSDPRGGSADDAPCQTGKYRRGSTGPGSDGILRIATNLLDVPAETIAVLYEHRWTIEIFFRFFKHVLGCRHLLSHDERGIEIQTSSAIIACMLISLWTGRKPSLRTYEMICYSISGLASEEELLAHIAKLPPQPPDS